MSKSQEFLDNAANAASVAHSAAKNSAIISPTVPSSSADSLDRADLAVFDPTLSTQSLRRNNNNNNHLAKSKTLPAGMTPPSAGDLLAMSMSSADFDAASKSTAPITKPSIPAPPPHVRRGHRRNVSDTSSIALALGLDGRRRMMVSTESPLSSAGLPNQSENHNNAAGFLRPPISGGYSGSVGSLPRRAKPHVASMSSLVDAMTSPSSQDGTGGSRGGGGSGVAGAAMMHQSLQVAGNARLTSSMDPLSVSTSLLNLSSLKNSDQESRQRGQQQTANGNSLSGERHPSAQSLGAGNAASNSIAASNGSLQQQQLHHHHQPTSNTGVAFNPFGDTKSFGELTENELFGKEFDEIRMNTSFTSESNSSTTTSNGSAATVVAAAPSAAAGASLQRRGSDEDDGSGLGMQAGFSARKRASLTLPEAAAKPMTTSISLDITSHDQ